jgi:UDP-3-O-[3-hydroxymyristoyl] glucosamine N-acyltransferase
MNHRLRPPLKISEIATALGAQVVGGGQVEISGISSIPTARAGDLVFVEDEDNLKAALSSQASAVIVGSFAESSSENTPAGVCARRQTVTRWRATSTWR